LGEKRVKVHNGHNFSSKNKRRPERKSRLGEENLGERKTGRKEAGLNVKKKYGGKYRTYD